MSDLIKAAKLWAKTSAKTGGTYYAGRMGGVRVPVLENRDRQGDGDPSHFLLLGDADAGQDRPQPRASTLPASGNPAPDPVTAPAKTAASPEARRGGGWRGPVYRRPTNPRPDPLPPQDDNVLNDPIDFA